MFLAQNEDETMKLFSKENTEGYSSAELEKLNAEWYQIVDAKQLEEFTEEYNIEAKKFSDVVSRR